MRYTALALVASLASFVVADDAVTCGNGQKCPEDKPCCSQWGECGTGVYCLGACDVRNSFNLSSCMPLPVCEDKELTFGDTSNFGEQSKWLGDPSQYDFITNNQVLEYDGNLLLPMQNGSYGTVITSTRAMWYGTLSATLKTSHGAGVVSAMILMSGSKDEIDYEFIGSKVGEAQTNYYYQGVLNYTNQRAVSLSNTNESFHTYEFDWTPDKITWKVDGQTARELNREDTKNETTGEYMFPQTPSVIQLSLWPGGSDVNPEGTVEWAGGPIDWNMPEFSDPGYLYVTVKDMTIKCGDVPDGTSTSGSKAYKFKGDGLTSADVEITDDNTTLASYEGVGFDPSKGEAINVSGQALPSNLAGGGNGAGAGNLSGSNATVQVISGGGSAATVTGGGKGSKSVQELNGFATTSTKDMPKATGDAEETADSTGFAQGSTDDSSSSDSSDDASSSSSSSQGAGAVVFPAVAPVLAGFVAVLAYLSL